MRHDITGVGWGWVAAFVGALAFTLLVFEAGIGARAVTRVDQSIALWLTELRTDVTTAVARAVHALGSEWTLRILRWGTMAVLLATRRLRHLVVFVGALLALEWLVVVLDLAIARPRPSVPIVGGWEGFAHPSRPVASVAVTLAAMSHALVPAGRWRERCLWVAVGVTTALGLARSLLGVDHATDVIVGATLGLALPTITARVLTPTAVFPVRYRDRGRAAHVELDRTRRHSIRTAVRDQLGFTVHKLAPFGLESSAGSTPLKLEVEGPEGPATLFAKLYDVTHQKSDRSFKLIRTLLYGRLEDERAFSSVRQLVEHEDYMLRSMADAAVPVARTYGVVEVVPAREYLTVTAFLDGAPLADSEVDDRLIDDGLRIVRRMWDSGLAHRDIKPGNVLVVGGRLHLVDVSFVQVRPSPWRQAVDLATMMLTLAVYAGAERVYARAIRTFSEDEVAEAFAAVRSAVMPTELRQLLADDERDLLTAFRELAPEHPPIAIQRWSLRRVALTMAVLAATGVGAFLAWVSFDTAGLL